MRTQPQSGSTGQRQTCKACGRPDLFNFHVSDEIWRRIVPGELYRSVVCLACFDKFAREMGVGYHFQTLYFAGDQFSAEFRAV